MTDIELTRRCAEAMGWKHLGAVGVPLTDEELRQGSPSKIDAKYPGKLWCLSGHNDWWQDPAGDVICQPCYDSVPKPLHDDAQAMALLKRYPYQCLQAMYNAVERDPGNYDLNRAIVDVVVQIEAAKVTT